MDRFKIEFGKVSLAALAAAALLLGTVYYLGEQTIKAGEQAFTTVLHPKH